MWYNEDKYWVKIGGNYYRNIANLLVYKGESLFTINRAESTELLGIDFDIYDNAGSKIAVVKQGRIFSGVPELYHIEKGADRYTLTERSSGRVICDIKKRTEAETELDVSVSLYTKDGKLFTMGPDATEIDGVKVGGNKIEDCGIGIEIR